MHIVSMIRQNRRDFTADFECEHCQRITVISGCDDYNLHHKVIPAMECLSCGEISPPEYVPWATKYPENVVL